MRLRQITESLESSSPVRWESNNHATFKVGKQDYDVYLDSSPATDPRLDGAVATAIQFQRRLGITGKLRHRFGRGPDAFGVSGTGGELAVFGTVLRVVKDFIGRHPETKCIAFIGLEDNRFGLYQKLAKRYARGWVQIATRPQLMLITQELYNIMSDRGMDLWTFPNQYWARQQCKYKA